jgi:two-component system phosphate regulon response regulator OmpR
VASRGVVQQEAYILVVEPDDLIRGLLERWLGEEGHTVLVEAAHGLPRPVGNRGDPLLVIVDVPMPRTAERLVQSVRETYGAPILLLSASLRRCTVASHDVARQLGVRTVLPKPFTRAELLLAVDEAIGGR